MKEGTTKLRDNVKGGALTEVTFFILLSLYTPRHGYAIMQFIEEITHGRLLLGAGTLYGALTALQKKGWGHSTYSIAVDFAVKWGIKKVGLFHHEPIYSDKKIFSFQRSAEWYKDYPNADYLSIIICQEGMQLEI